MGPEALSVDAGGAGERVRGDEKAECAQQGAGRQGAQPGDRQLRGLARTITLDNGAEFHDYERVEEASGVKFYFATPYHSWERGTNGNTMV